LRYKKEDRMMGLTDRLKLPLLAVAQAQKEVTHNEALALIDMYLQPNVESVGLNTAPASPIPGQCWIVGSAPTGAWVGQGNAIAAWTGGGWRFATATEGMQFWSRADNCSVRKTSFAWVIGQLTAATLSVAGQQVVGTRQAAVAGPSGGATIDSEARAAINALLTALRTHGLIAAA
jgi:hypothetical protein